MQVINSVIFMMISKG